MADKTNNNPRGYDCMECGRRKNEGYECSKPADRCPLKGEPRATAEELEARYAHLMMWRL